MNVKLLQSNGIHPDVFKDKIQGLHQSNTSYLLWLLSLHGRHVSTSSRSSSGPNLRIQILHKLTHKMQVHIHCKQLGPQLAFYESIYVRSVFLN